jgi:hypothetical protein
VEDADLQMVKNNWDSGTIFGAGTSGIEKFVKVL